MRRSRLGSRWACILIPAGRDLFRIRHLIHDDVSGVFYIPNISESRPFCHFKCISIGFYQHLSKGFLTTKSPIRVLPRVVRDMYGQKGILWYPELVPWEVWYTSMLFATLFLRALSMDSTYKSDCVCQTS